MKSERRHELQHNDLAEWIFKGYERIVPYKNAIFGASLLLAVLFIGLAVWHNHSVSESEEAWNKLGVPVFDPVFSNEPTISAMDQAAKTYQGEPAAEWAQVFAADTALMAGTNRVITNKKVGIEFLNDAEKRYSEALKTLTIPGAREQAMFGKARAMESLIKNGDDLKAAKEAYEELKKSYPNGMFKMVADQRIDQLQKSDALKFYEALAQYSPKPKLESPRSKLEGLTPLPDNPTDEPVTPNAPGRTGSQSMSTPGIPVPSLTPTEPVKPQAVKPETSKPDDVKPEIRKPETPNPETVRPETQKTEPTKPEPPKKDK